MKIFKVESCDMCPYALLDFDKALYDCALLKKYIYNEEEIHSDCPLDDVSEKESILQEMKSVPLRSPEFQC